MPRHPASPPKVAVVAFNGISSFHLSVPCVVFGESFPGTPRFALTVCSWERGPLATTSGFDIRIRHSLAALDEADIVIVPSWRNPDEAVPRRCAGRCGPPCARCAGAGLCLGAYALAEAACLTAAGRRRTGPSPRTSRGAIRG